MFNGICSGFAMRAKAAGRALSWAAVLAALLLCANLPPRAAGCIGSDGTVPPWKGSGANPLMAARIKSAHAFAKANKLSAPLFPVIAGTHKVVIILVENAGGGAAFGSAYRPASLWNARIHDFDNYYNEVSRGKLRMAAAAESHGTANDGVIGPVTVSSLNSGSSVDWSNSPTITAQAIRAANPYINFSAFDKNGDHVLTSDELHIAVYQAGDERSYSFNSTPRAWAHMQYYSGGLPWSIPSTDSDGMRLTSYVYCGSELNGSRMATMGQMTHELGHDIGLPDLYDTDSTKDWRGLGTHCLMAAGSWGGVDGAQPVHLDGFFKKWMGWAAATEVSAPANRSFTLPAANGSNAVVQLNVPGSDEFFVIENRQQTGFDAGLPGAAGGLAVYHCDHGVLQDQSVLNYITDISNNINHSRTDFAIKVEEADGDDALGKNNSDQGSDRDYFRSGLNTAFNAATNPNSKLKNGAASNISISGIGASGASMSFNVGAPPPILNSFSIDNGAASAASRDVTLNSICSGSPQYYLASEYSDFSGGATWRAWASAVPFHISSSGNGTKTVYFKVKDANNLVSNWKSDTIALNETTPPPVLTGFKINNGAATTYSRTVTLNNTWTGGAPAKYLASESSNFANATWIAWSAAPSFTLSAGNGTKTVYFKVKTAGNLASNWMSDTIVLNEQAAPGVTSFKINNGAASAYSRTVTLNNTCTGAPTQYMASESSSFSGASWIVWSGAPSFKITSANNGAKTVYFKVKNAYGVTSAVLKDTIVLSELIALTVNGAKVGGSIAQADYDTYQFTLATAGWVTILTEAGTLKDGYLFLFDNQWNKLAEADDQGGNWMPMISKYLAAGTYLLELDGNTDSDYGTYSISVRTGSAYKTLAIDGGWTSGNIDDGQHVDWYQITVGSKGTYTIETLEGGLADGVMFLYRMNGVYWLAMNDDQVDYYNSAYHYPTMPAISTTLEAGTYYVAVHGYSSKATGSYTIRARKGNSGVTTMSPVVNGPALNWSIGTSLPNNFYTFTVTQTATYTLTTAAGSMSDAQMTLNRLTLNASNQYVLTFIASNKDASSSNYMPKIAASLSPGTYLVWVGGEYLDTGSYSLTLTR